MSKKQSAEPDKVRILMAPTYICPKCNQALWCETSHELTGCKEKQNEIQN